MRRSCLPSLLRSTSRVSFALSGMALPAVYQPVPLEDLALYALVAALNFAATLIVIGLTTATLLLSGVLPSREQWQTVADAHGRPGENPASAGVVWIHCMLP